jgi:hypothetical protein
MTLVAQKSSDIYEVPYWDPQAVLKGTKTQDFDPFLQHPSGVATLASLIEFHLNDIIEAVEYFLGHDYIDSRTNIKPRYQQFLQELNVALGGEGCKQQVIQGMVNRAARSKRETAPFTSVGRALSEEHLVDARFALDTDKELIKRIKCQECIQCPPREFDARLAYPITVFVPKKYLSMGIWVIHRNPQSLSGVVLEQEIGCDPDKFLGNLTVSCKSILDKGVEVDV